MVPSPEAVLGARLRFENFQPWLERLAPTIIAWTLISRRSNLWSLQRRRRPFFSFRKLSTSARATSAQQSLLTAVAYFAEPPEIRPTATRFRSEKSQPFLERTV